MRKPQVHLFFGAHPEPGRPAPRPSSIRSAETFNVKERRLDSELALRCPSSLPHRQRRCSNLAEETR